MPAYFLLIAFYCILTILIILNVFVARQFQQHIYLGIGIKLFSISYYVYLALIIVISHIYILSTDWSTIITSNDIVIYFQ